MYEIRISELNQQTNKWETARTLPALTTAAGARQFALKWVGWQRSEGCHVDTLKNEKGEISGYRTHAAGYVAKLELFRK